MYKNMQNKLEEIHSCLSKRYNELSRMHQREIDQQEKLNEMAKIAKTEESIKEAEESKVCVIVLQKRIDEVNWILARFWEIVSK